MYYGMKNFQRSHEFDWYIHWKVNFHELKQYVIWFILFAISSPTARATLKLIYLLHLFKRKMFNTFSRWIMLDRIEWSLHKIISLTSATPSPTTSFYQTSGRVLNDGAITNTTNELAYSWRIVNILFICSTDRYCCKW